MRNAFLKPEIDFFSKEIYPIFGQDWPWETNIPPIIVPCDPVRGDFREMREMMIPPLGFGGFPILADEAIQPSLPQHLKGKLNAITSIPKVRSIAPPNPLVLQMPPSLLPPLTLVLGKPLVRDKVSILVKTLPPLPHRDKRKRGSLRKPPVLPVSPPKIAPPSCPLPLPDDLLWMNQPSPLLLPIISPLMRIFLMVLIQPLPPFPLPLSVPLALLPSPRNPKRLKPERS
jgi:hypothetical protein